MLYIKIVSAISCKELIQLDVTIILDLLDKFMLKHAYISRLCIFIYLDVIITVIT